MVRVEYAFDFDKDVHDVSKRNLNKGTYLSQLNSSKCSNGPFIALSGAVLVERRTRNKPRVRGLKLLNTNTEDHRKRSVTGETTKMRKQTNTDRFKKRI